MLQFSALHYATENYIFSGISVHITGNLIDAMLKSVCLFVHLHTIHTLAGL